MPESPFVYRVGMTVTVLLIAACGADSSTSPEPSSTPTGTETSSGSESETGSHLPRIEVPVEADARVEGLIDVDGHAARCSGIGTPTVVYFAGWAPDQRKLGVDTIQAVEAADAGRHRICSYERRNTGRSETVDGTQSPEEIVADVDGVLEAIGEDGPFVLLGASFGGLVAAPTPLRTATGSPRFSCSTPRSQMTTSSTGATDSRACV